MDIFLAGGISGNLFPSFRKFITEGGAILKESTGMNIYLAGEHPVKNGKIALKIARGETDMDLFLAGTLSRPYVIEQGKGFKILESFYYCRENEVIPRLMPLLGDFLLDSGAFSFMSGKSSVKWDLFIEEYAAWINRYQVKKFFELDIDSIVGIKEVERLRAKLERLTGIQPIPVWHKSRGKDYFQGMARDYPYVAIGGIVTQEIPRKIYESGFPWFISEAHKAGAKIHGLGYTSIEGIHKYHFDSVDSTAWLYGNRGGYLYRFQPRTGDFDKIKAPGGHRLKSSESAMWNFNEWIKFQNYAEKYL